MERRDVLRVGALATTGLWASACKEPQVKSAAAASSCTQLDAVPPAQAEVIAPGEGEKTDNGLMVYKIRAGKLGNYWSMMEGELEPLQLLAPHTHDDYDQAVYLIEGELEFEFGGKGGQRYRGVAGSYVVKPRGLSHTFWNPGDKLVRYIELSANVTFEHFVDESAVSKNLIETEKAAQRHGVAFHYDQIPRLLAENGLTSVRGVAVELPQLKKFQKPGG